MNTSFQQTLLLSNTVLGISSSISDKEWKTLNYLKIDRQKKETVLEDKEIGITEFDTSYFSNNEKIADTIIDTSVYGNNWIILNSYGALILCSNDLLIVDIDSDSINRLDYKKIRARLRDYFTKIYKTKAGYRIISTFPCDYGSSVGLYRIVKILEEFGCDPKYIECMERQRYGRARLTPKPWRYNGYERVKVCKLLKQFGDIDSLSASQKEAIETHDILCKINLLFAKLA